MGGEAIWRIEITHPGQKTLQMKPTRAETSREGKGKRDDGGIIAERRKWVLGRWGIRSRAKQWCWCVGVTDDLPERLRV